MPGKWRVIVHATMIDGIYAVVLVHDRVAMHSRAMYNNDDNGGNEEEDDEIRKVR